MWQITMVGVWDTASIHSEYLRASAESTYRLRLSRHWPASEHSNACHALAIDERRAQFPPTLWKGPAAPGQTLEQVWFTGAHSDVGGGEPDDLPGLTTALSDMGTLGWMMSKASALGLQFGSTTVLNQRILRRRLRNSRSINSTNRGKFSTDSREGVPSIRMHPSQTVY